MAMAGYGYALMDNYFLPPVNFTTDEALMLILGSDIMQQNFDAQYQHAALSGAIKIEAILPKHLLSEITYLRQNFTLFGMKNLNEKNAMHLSQIRRAMIERQCLRITYTRRITDAGYDDLTTRTIAPYSLASLEHDWYLMAHCYLREAIRIFRLSRIDSLELLPTRFERPANFTPEWEKSNRPRQVCVKVRVTDSIIRWVRESRPFSLVQEEAVDNGWELTFHVQQAEELLVWILGWGRHIEVVEPQSLRQTVVTEIMQMLEVHQD
jgi:predicted DNA-binding transcriptional regulator YafY